MRERPAVGGDGNPQVVRFPAQDGFMLGGLLCEATGTDPVNTSTAAVFAPGGGVRAATYRHFLGYLAQNGIPVLALDYRGIGESRPPQLSALEATVEDWAEHDPAGAIEWVHDRYPNAAIVGIGHSFGALLIGASKEAALFSQLILVAPHTGYFGDYEAPLRWILAAAWRTLAPATIRILGYFPAHLFRLGEDIPRGVALQWYARTAPSFVDGHDRLDPVRKARILANMKALRVPTLVLSFSDDAWGTEMGVRRLLAIYQGLLVARRPLSPARGDRRGIGHWGFFSRRQRETLWPLVTQFLLTGAAGRASPPSTLTFGARP